MGSDWTLNLPEIVEQPRLGLGGIALEVISWVSSKLSILELLQIQF